MPARDLPENPSVTAAKRAASVGSFSQASSFEEVRFEELEHSDSDSERAQAKAEANSKAASAITTSNLKPGSNSLTPAPVLETANMHMVDSENDLLQPQSKKDITLRELHDPIEGDSADISWRGNHDLKANAAKEAKAHDVAGDNPKDFDPLRDVERAAQKAAALAGATVNNLNLKDVQSKLTAGATEAKSSMFKLATDVSSWWANLDPGVPKPSQPAASSATRSASDAQQSSTELVDLFGLGPEEELLERFACALLQTYLCTHNTFTPEQQLQFPGTLYITAQHICFNSCTKDGQDITVLLQHKQVQAVHRLSSRKRGEGASLKVEIGDNKFLTFTDFPSTDNGDVDSAHALFEHLSDAA